MVFQSSYTLVGGYFIINGLSLALDPLRRTQNHLLFQMKDFNEKNLKFIILKAKKLLIKHYLINLDLYPEQKIFGDVTISLK